MLAITVTLGTVTGTFVLDIGETPDAPPSVGVSIDQYEESGGLYTVDVQLITNEGADWVSVENNGLGSYDTSYGDGVDYDNGGGGEDDIDEVGERVVINGLNPGDRIYVQAGYMTDEGEKRVVVQEYVIRQST